MTHHQTFLILLFLQSAACSSPAAAPRGPGSPTPVADPRSGPATTEGGRSGAPATEAADRPDVPVRPDQAPLIAVRDALEADSLLGRRVRISGRCAARGSGRRAGFWTLDQDGSTIEVRGLVPSPCPSAQGEDLTIFAQIEPEAAGSRDRILLRLPD